MGPDCPDPRACFLGEAGGGEEESKESVFTPRCSHLAGGCPVTVGWREGERRKKKKKSCVVFWQRGERGCGCLCFLEQVGSSRRC